MLDGQKRFITNAPLADLFVVFARTRPTGESGTGIAVFLVPAASPGLRVGPKDKKMGQDGAWTTAMSASPGCGCPPPRWSAGMRKPVTGPP